MFMKVLRWIFLIIRSCPHDINCLSKETLFTRGLTIRMVQKAAITKHGKGTKVKLFHDGSGHILPPPPYREEESLYGFENEYQLRRRLPSLGILTYEEWKNKCVGLSV